jgi:hypothetical protein
MAASETSGSAGAAPLALALLGALFLLFGAMLAAAAYPYAVMTIEWADATTTTGRVIATEWLEESGENRLKISYAYKDETDAIFHTTTVLPRKLGKLNPEPGMPIGVLYKPGAHGESKLTIEVNGRYFWTLVCAGVLEALVGAGFILVAWRRRFPARLPPVAAGKQTFAVKNDNTPV